MTIHTPASTRTARQPRSSGIARYLPILGWIFNYRREDLVSDVVAGLIVAIMLVPQGMAYALLAGLPPEIGLYASIAPPFLYSLLGTSPSLAVGPVAIISLLVASSAGQIAPSGSPEYISFVLGLALLVGILQLVMGLVRLGFLVNFLSHSVMAGFTSAAALVIGISQLKHLMGVSIPDTPRPYELMAYTLGSAAESNLMTVGVGIGGLAILIFFTKFLRGQLERVRTPTWAIEPVTKSGPLVAVLIGTLVVWGFALNQREGIKIVGAIPQGLPPLTVPTLDWAGLEVLLPNVFVIVLVGIAESISIAKVLAGKRRQKVHADQEMVALGVANLGAALTGGYPVTGSFSRSAVNFASGARTCLSSMITSVLLALTMVFLTPLFYFLPHAVLGAIIIIAAASLFDIATFKRTWRYSKADGASMLVTFFAVMLISIEAGIVVGIITAIALYLLRTSKPHVAVLGRVGETEHFRNVLRHDVTTYPGVLVLRIDESLYFANTKHLEDSLLSAVADHREARHLVLICSGINFIDASALETLERLIEELRDAGVSLYLAEVKGTVMDRLKKVGFIEHLGAERVFFTAHQAIEALAQLDQEVADRPAPL